MVMYYTINLEIETILFLYGISSSVKSKDLQLLRDKCIILVTQEHLFYLYFAPIH